MVYGPGDREEKAKRTNRDLGPEIFEPLSQWQKLLLSDILLIDDFKKIL
jgi:hypothetical protein